MTIIFISCLQIGHGLLRSMKGDRHAIADLIPCDIAVKAIIAVAWHTAVEKWVLYYLLYWNIYITFRTWNADFPARAKMYFGPKTTCQLVCICTASIYIYQTNIWGILTVFFLLIYVKMIDSCSVSRSLFVHESNLTLLIPMSIKMKIWGQFYPTMVTIPQCTQLYVTFIEIGNTGWAVLLELLFCLHL